MSRSKTVFSCVSLILERKAIFIQFGVILSDLMIPLRFSFTPLAMISGLNKIREQIEIVYRVVKDVSFSNLYALEHLQLRY